MTTEKRDPRDPILEERPDIVDDTVVDDAIEEETPEEKRNREMYPPEKRVSDALNGDDEDEEDYADKLETGNNARRIEDRQGGYGSGSSGGPG